MNTISFIENRKPNGTKCINICTHFKDKVYLDGPIFVRMEKNYVDLRRSV